MATEPTPSRYAYAELAAFAREALAAAGLGRELTPIVAERMLDADLMGHDTHGLALLPRYLRELGDGTTRRSGDIEILSDRGASSLWDADNLPGHFVLDRAMHAGVERARRYGSATIAIRRSQHIGALQVYLPTATDAGCLALIWATDTQARSVAAFGGLDPVLTSEPIAIGIPTSGEPILVDMSTSLTSNAAVKRAAARGQRLSSPMLLDGAGNLSDDPGVLATDPPGTILPLGGLLHGHKGFGLALAVSAMSLALPGWGRAMPGKRQGIVLQVLDPDAFGGRDAFVAEVDGMAAASRASRVRPGDPPVRLPGERAQAFARRQRSEGLAITEPVMAAAVAATSVFNLAAPEPQP